MMKLHVYDTKQALGKAFSDHVAEGIRNSKTYNIALSGGSTPKLVFNHMAEHYQDLPWENVRFYWGDERCVPPDHEESNYKMANDLLISKVNSSEKQVFRMKGENQPDLEAARYEKLLRENLPVANGIPQFDLIILGMGDDGHTASIFPNQIELWYSSNLCEVATHPDTGQKRVTFTGNIINSAREVAFLVAGESKKEKVAEVLSTDPDKTIYPASLVAPEPGNLEWFLDEAAAGNLKQ